VIKTRRAFGAVAALAIAGTSIFAGSAAQAADKETIGFSPIALAIPPLAGLAEGVKGVGASKGFDVVVFDPNFDPVAQAEQLTQAINAGTINAAWVISVAPEANAAVAKLAQEKKVPIVFNGVPKDYGFSGPQATLSFATIPYAKVGSAMGLTAGQCINKKSGGKAEVILLTSAPGTAGKAEQDAAAKKWLTKTAKGAKIVQTVVQSDVPKSQKAIAAALQRHPNATAVVGGNNEGTTAALNAFKAAGKKLNCVTMNGGDDPVIDKALAKGQIWANAELQFKDDLMQTFAELERLLKDPSSTGKLLSVPVKVVKGKGA
jgi:ABC-type sugar transport system substrate-binding protein